VTRGRDGVATGARLEELVFTNTGTTPCLLRGYPSITADTPTGPRTLHPRRGPVFYRHFAADMPPKGHVLLDFGTSDCGCRCLRPNPVAYRNLAFALPQGGRVRTRISITVDCFLSMTAFGLPGRIAETKAHPGTPGMLKARIDLPRTVRAGATIFYTVTLSNPTDVAVSLRPCPSYTNGAARSFALNCDTVHAIPPHGHVAYAMRIRIPEKYTRAGVAKVVWSLNTPTGPYAVAAAAVTQG
jgi:hypothetical protein